jgi:hypothetical protein
LQYAKDLLKSSTHWRFRRLTRGEKFGGLMFNRVVVFNKTTFFIIIFLVLISSTRHVYAVADFGTAAVLPVDRHQTIFRFGNVSGIQDKFNKQGVLQSPSRMNQRFDNTFLMKNPEFQKLAHVIDQLLPNQKPSKDIDLGSLEFKGDASVSYFSPQIARGITSNWSLGIAIPIVRYNSDVRAENGGVNTAKGILAGLSDKMNEAGSDIGSAVEDLNGGPRVQFANQLELNSYKPLSERNEQFLGDIVLGSSLKLYDTKFVDFYLLNQLTLPTGPKDDPDDLVDLNIFGKTQFQTVLYTNYDIWRWLELGLGLSYNWGITDDIEKRVPRSEEDSLPPAYTKENLKKNPGDSVGIQFASIARLSDYIHVGAGYEVYFKQKDRYYGDRGSRYDLLEKNTDSEASIAKFKFTYSTLDGFLKGDEKIPYSVTYAFADHVSGKNVERELNHELLFKFYF